MNNKIGASASSSGFSLAELLSALVIFAVISTFSIPKVLNAQKNEHYSAVLKENIALLSELVYRGTVLGELPQGSETKMGYFSSRINALKICSVNANKEACWSHASATRGIETQKDEGAMIMHNGSVIAGFHPTALVNNGFPADHIAIDINGAQGPNREGEDQISLTVCWGVIEDVCARAGVVTARVGETESESFYNRTFSN